MTEGQCIHTEFETITDYQQDYRISTRVTFFASGTYKCKVKLYKSYGGKVRGDPMYTYLNRTSDEDNVETLLQEGIDTCRDKIEAIEQAKCLDISVTVVER